MKTSKFPFFVVVLIVLSILAGCAQPAAAPAQPTAPAAAEKTYKDMTLCFPQLGAESDWRTADTASFKETAAQLGIKQLVFSDAQQKQENQISAVRACIQQGVDVIAFPPVVEGQHSRHYCGP
jgi:ABC-type sugar transport system substrate-binding protein